MDSEDRLWQSADDLMGRVYTATRGGTLDAAPVLELAAVLRELGRVGPAARKLLERPAAELSADEVARLGAALLRDANFEPTFAVDPTLWTTLERALAIVERDVRAAGITGTLRLIRNDWNGGRHALVEFRGCFHGNGLWPDEGESLQGAVANVAEAAQETIMELVWKVWPVCVTHDRGAHVAWADGAGVWQCTADGTHVVAPIGELAGSPHR